MFKKVLAYFDHQAWKYELPEPEGSLAYLGIETENEHEFSCLVHVMEEEGKIVFFSIFPIHAPAKRRSSLANVLLAINYSLFWGSFEMDFEDGEIRCKTSFVYADMELSFATIELMIHTNIIVMDTYFHLIQAFIEKKISLPEIKMKVKELSN